MLAKAYQEMAGDFDVYQQIIDLFETEIAENWFLEIKLPFSKLFVNFLGKHQKINKSLLMCRPCHLGRLGLNIEWFVIVLILNCFCEIHFWAPSRTKKGCVISLQNLLSGYDYFFEKVK